MAVAPTDYPNNLPGSSSSFIGREREIADVTRLLMSARLLTLTGPGGSGKTRLALAAARDLPAFEHGAWFVDLSGLNEASLVPQAVAIVLGVPETRGCSLDDTLTEYLRPKQLLLILDNCEHLLTACTVLAQRLHEHCPDLLVLATSREPLNVPDEIVWLVPSLSLPARDAPASPAAESEAVQLFVARAREALPGFKIDDSNAATIAQICYRLDGIPLAIELAAARVKLLDVVQIAARLDDSLQLLTRGNYATAPRHQTLRATLDWSYQLLQPRERTLFVRLAVFARGCTLEAVESVCADDGRLSQQAVETGGLYAIDALDLLSNLVDKSLVLIAEREAGESVRYRLLEPIRQYALEKLRQAGEEATICDRHLAYSIEFAEQVESQIKGEKQLLWLKRLDKEHDNLHAALGWSVQAANDSISGLRLAKALHMFWQRRSYWSEGRRWLQQAIATYDSQREHQSPISELYLARAIVAEGWLAVYSQDYSNTRASLERGLALAQASGDSVTTAHALGLLSFLTTYAGNFTAASQFAVASVASARQAGAPWSVAWALHVLGRNRDGVGDISGGRAALEESEALFRETGDRRMLAVHINTMAIIAQNAGELEAARDLFEETLKIGQALEDNELQLKALGNLAGLAMVQGDIQRAEQIYEQTLHQNRSLGTQLMATSCFIGLARIRILQGDFERAEQLLRECLALIHGRDHQASLAMSLAGLSRIYAERGKTRQAAWVWGVIDPVLQRRIDADDQASLDEWQTAVRAAMTPEEFKAGFAAGQGLTLEQAIQEVTSLAPESKQDVQLPVPALPALGLNALGPVRVFLGEHALTNWPYARVKELLFYLISHPTRTKAQFGLALWPQASPAQLRNSLSTTLYHLRRVLGDAQWIIFEDDLYRFNRRLNYQFDVEVFEAKLVQASRVQAPAPDRAIALWQEAVALYHGDFVEDFLEGDWFLLRREELRRKYLSALLSLGHLLFTQSQYVRAAEFYRHAIEKDEVLEEAHRELMRCYVRLGERGQALRHYQVFEQLMRDELGSAPAAESAALYERLKRGEEV